MADYMYGFYPWIKPEPESNPIGPTKKETFKLPSSLHSVSFFIQFPSSKFHNGDLGFFIITTMASDRRVLRTSNGSVNTTPDYGKK